MLQKIKLFQSIFDGLGMGLGFAVALTLLGAFREILGTGSIFGVKFIPSEYNITIFVLAPGAFFVLACLIAIKNRIDRKNGKKKEDELDSCAGCSGAGCGGAMKKEEA